MYNGRINYLTLWTLMYCKLSLISLTMIFKFRNIENKKHYKIRVSAEESKPDFALADLTRAT